jgi:hypothetical protein
MSFHDDNNNIVDDGAPCHLLHLDNNMKICRVRDIIIISRTPCLYNIIAV